MSTLKSHPDKELLNHLRNVAINTKRKIANKNLNLSLLKKEELTDLAYLIGVCHDFGKATTYFQEHLFGKTNAKLSNHGLISALLGYFLAEKLLGEDSIFSISAYILIKRHHGDLDSPIEPIYEFEPDVKKQLQNIEQNHKKETIELYKKLLTDYDFDLLDAWYNLKNLDFGDFIDDIEDKIFDFDEINGKDKGIELFLITNLLYSALIDSDKKDAAEVDNSYFAGCLNEKVSVSDYIEHCRKEDPEKFDPEKPINKQRNHFFQEIINNEKITPKNKIYTLTAPTGIGKTFGAFAFANKLKEKLGSKARIIYSLPFTSIIDQNHTELEKIIKFNLKVKYENAPTKYLLKHHYLAPMELENYKETKNENEKYENYLDDLLLIEAWESANIVTTFIQLFYSTIGYKNSFLRKFHNIVNSIILLDEVQNIPGKYHKITGDVFRVLAERFNTYFLLMTATQPDIFSEEESVALVDYPKYFSHQIFNRVNLHIVDNLKEMTIEDFVDYFKSNFQIRSGLIVCNTKRSAIKIYQDIKNNFSNYHCYSLTTYLTPKDRQDRIVEIGKRVKNQEKVIVVSTQLIEAGVDLSFQEVYRDISPFDSVVQVAGRCNRNGEFENKGNTYLLQLTEGKKKPSAIYDQKLLQNCKETIANSVLYESSDFLNLSKEYFMKFDFEFESNRLLTAIKMLNYSTETTNETPVKKFRLIKNIPDQDDLIICTEKDAENKIQELQELLETLKKTDRDKQKEKFNLLSGKIESLKKEINKYRITLYSSDLDEYRDSGIIQSVFSYLKYISYKDQKEYLYDREKGFLKKPKKQLNNYEIL